MNEFDKQHLKNIVLTKKQIDQIFNIAAREAAAIGVSIHDFNSDKPFSFADYPKTKARIDNLIKSLHNNVETVIVNGSRQGWTLANNKNSALADRVFGENKYKLTKTQERRYYNNNDKALEAFIARKTAGLNLSDRVWNITDQFKEGVEMGLDLGIRNGLSAAEIARDLKQYLKEPDKLFRRVRDEHGELHLSRSAKKYSPGQGVYRSSYKNAMRLARTENNISYRTADYLRWQQLDFVVGIEIRLSNNHTLGGREFEDICDELQGKYPKDFKFTGWHPQCRCHAISILKTPEELAEDTERILNGEETDTTSKNEIKDVPANFTKWVKDNADRIENANNRGALPYFLKDNMDLFDLETNAETLSLRKKLEQQIKMMSNDEFNDLENFVRSVGDANRSTMYYGLKEDIVEEMLNLIYEGDDYKTMSSVEYYFSQKNVIISKDEHFQINKHYDELSGIYACYIRTTNSMKINYCLNKGVKEQIYNGIKLEWLPDDDKTVRILDRLISGNKIERNIKVFRHCGTDWLDDVMSEKNITDFNLLKGEVVKNTGYFSSSALEKNNVFKNRNVHIRANVNKGTNAYVTDNLPESEIIFRNIKYEINKIEKSGDEYYLDITIL